MDNSQQPSKKTRLTSYLSITALVFSIIAMAFSAYNIGRSQVYLEFAEEKQEEMRKSLAEMEDLNASNKAITQGVLAAYQNDKIRKIEEESEDFPAAPEHEKLPTDAHAIPKKN